MTEETKEVQFVDDDVTTIRNDIERVQRKPTMYISYMGTDAVGHLAKEAENNMIDEHDNPNSISKGQFSIFHDCGEQMTYFQDDGRGIPFEELENVCTILQSGSKMDRDNGSSAGENGVGLTAINALSEIFEITSTRNGLSRQLRFREGKLISDRTISIQDKTKHGLLVGFKPSKYFLNDTAVFPWEEFGEWNERIFFFTDPEIKLTYTIDNIPGKAAPIVKKFQNTTGIAGYIPKIFPEAKLLAKPVAFEEETKVVENNIIAVDDLGSPIRDNHGNVQMTSRERSMKLAVSFNYDPEGTSEKFMSYCNQIENIQGGFHQVAVKNAIVSYFTKTLRATAKKTDPDVTADDVMNGIYVVVSVNTDMNPKFESQTKHKLGNREFYEPIRKLCLNALTNYFKLQENQKTLKAISENIRINAKLRTDSTKARKKAKSSSSFMALKSNSLVEYTPANYINSPHRLKDGEKLELFIVEGSSAAGQARSARYNPNYQGVLATRGRPTNIWEMTATSIQSKNNMWDYIFNEVLGCGYGRHFNIDNLKYERIILGSDADVDGSHISGLFSCGIVKHAPELIEAGCVFRSVTPLYRLRLKRSKNAINPEAYIYTKTELYNRFERLVSTQLRLKFNEDDDKFISQVNMRRFLETNRDYYTTLDYIRTQYKIDLELIEYIISHPDFRNTISEIGSELVYDKTTDTISGPFNGEHRTIVLEKVLVEKLDYLRKILHIGNEDILYYYLYEKIGGEFHFAGRKSIGEIMENCQKFWPDLERRFKGLGEMSEDEIYDMMMNPKNRLLIQFTMLDAKRAMQTFDDLFMKSRRDVRKKWVSEAEVSIDDIDT